MSPAGAGAAHFREANTARSAFACAGLLVTAFVVLLLMLSGGSPAHASPAPVAPLTPAWSAFQNDCVAGPAPGQGSTPQACVCWESHLEAAAIVPGYAVDALNAAEVGGGAASTVRENLAGGLLGPARNGCGLG